MLLSQETDSQFIQFVSKTTGSRSIGFSLELLGWTEKNSTVQCQLRCGYIIIKIIVDGTHPNWGECSRHTPHLRWYWNWLRQFRLIMMRESGTLIPSTTTKAAVVRLCTHARMHQPPPPCYGSRLANYQEIKIDTKQQEQHVAVCQRQWRGINDRLLSDCLQVKR